MIREIVYSCRVCNREWNTKKEAIKCQISHEPARKEWARCEVCAQAWLVGYMGLHWAINNAIACEKEHRDKGEVEEVAVRTFFSSKGCYGRYYSDKWRNDQIIRG